MGASRDFWDFVQQNIGEDRWHELCDTFESTVVLLQQGLVGGEYVDTVLRDKVCAMLGRLNTEELALLEHLLDRHETFKHAMLDAIKAARQEKI
jgi:hypothetical protein